MITSLTTCDVKIQARGEQMIRVQGQHTLMVTPLSNVDRKAGLLL